jgi:hypothetical protein
MRLITVGLGIALLLATSVAAAAPQGGSAGQKGDTGGKGGLGPEGSTQSGAGGSAEQGGSVDTSLQQFGKGGAGGNEDKTANKVNEEKPWEISGTFETHHLLEGNFITTDASLKTFNILFLAGRYNITQNDTVSLAGGAIQYLQADQGETGFRAFDLSLAYTHRFQLPEKFNLATTGSVTAPISYASQLASNITTPSLGVTLSRKFGDLYVALNVRGSVFIDRYTSAGSNSNSVAPGGGSTGTEATNPKASLGGALTAEYNMPFYRPWSIGAALVDSYVWYYDVGQCPAQTTCPGATSNPLTDGQPFQQSYGGEIFTRYVLPDLAGFKSDIMLALANGDPGLGYPTVLHDGVVHPYLFYYNTAEVYVALEGRY